MDYGNITLYTFIGCVIAGILFGYFAYGWTRHKGDVKRTIRHRNFMMATKDMLRVLALRSLSLCFNHQEEVKNGRMSRLFYEKEILSSRSQTLSTFNRLIHALGCEAEIREVGLESNESTEDSVVTRMRQEWYK